MRWSGRASANSDRYCSVDMARRPVNAMERSLEVCGWGLSREKNHGSL